MTSLDQSFRDIISTVYLNAGSTLDLTNAHVLRRRIRGAFDRTSGTVILVCTQLSLIDLDGLDMLVEVSTEARSRGLRLRLVNPSSDLRDLVALVGVTDELDLDDEARRDILARVPSC
jgi:anti-anti-sigma factor